MVAVAVDDEIVVSNDEKPYSFSSGCCGSSVKCFSGVLVAVVAVDDVDWLFCAAATAERVQAPTNLACETIIRYNSWTNEMKGKKGKYN